MAQTRVNDLHIPSPCFKVFFRGTQMNNREFDLHPKDNVELLMNFN